jgi:hypothetical protein
MVDDSFRARLEPSAYNGPREDRTTVLIHDVVEA